MVEVVDDCVAGFDELAQVVGVEIIDVGEDPTLVVDDVG